MKMASLLKEALNKDTRWPQNRQCVQNFHGSCTSIYGTKLFFAFLGAAILVHSLTMKSRKRLAHDVMYISATHAYLVHDV